MKDKNYVDALEEKYMLTKACLMGDVAVNSQATTLYESLKDNIKANNWNSITICSAYLTTGAAEILVELFKEITTRKHLKINILIGSKDYFTQPEAIEVLLIYFAKQRKSNIEYYFVQPLDTRFHIKCYVFLGSNHNKVVIGSANLTISGLNSFGELLIEVNDNETINQVVKHLDYYYTNSVLWREAITEYVIDYEKNAPQFHQEAYQNYANSLKKRIKKSKMITIRLTSPTIGELYSLESQKVKRVSNKIAEIQKKSPDLAKSNWILFEDLSCNEVKRNYSIGSWFDRPEKQGHYWDVGARRMLGRVGAIVSMDEDGVVLLMRKRSIHYQVSEEILAMAKKLGIKTDDDGEMAPTKKDLDKYVDFIIKNR